jgi:hypothetical protein
MTDVVALISPNESKISIGINWLWSKVELILMMRVMLFPRSADQVAFVVES